jgi:transcriptional regulator with XRE-family HTH domain
MDKLTHWTNRSIDDFVFRVSADFVGQLERKLESEPLTYSQFARRLKLTVGRVSQVLNTPGNLTLRNTVKFARALGMKVAVVAYEDNDPQNKNGPINSEVFHTCWKNFGAPRDLFQLSDSFPFVQQVGVAAPPTQGDIFLHRGSSVNHANARLRIENLSASANSINN